MDDFESSWDLGCPMNLDNHAKHVMFIKTPDLMDLKFNSAGCLLMPNNCLGRVCPGLSLVINAGGVWVLYNSYSLLMSKKKLSKVIILGDSA